MRSFRKTFLADDSRLVDSYLLPGLSALLLTATVVRTGGDLPLPPFFTTLGREQPKVLGLAFLGLFLLNGWFFDGILTRRTKVEGRPPRWLRLCRFCFAGIPLLGIYSFPVWDWMARKGIWKDRDKATTSPPAVIFHPASHVVPVLTILVWGLNLLLLYSAVIWSSTVSIRSLPMAVQWGFQGLGFLCVQIDIISLRRNRFLSTATHLLLYFFSILWLLPQQACVVAGLAHMFLVLARSEPKLRMRGLLQGRFDLGDRLSNATGRDWWKVSGWRAWRLPTWLTSSPEQGFGDDGRLYRVKVLLTIFDAIALVLAIRLLSKTWPAAGKMLVSFGVGILPFSVLLALLGMLVLAADFAIRHLGRTLIYDPAHHLSLKYFVLTQMALLSGVWIGHLLMTGESWRLGLFLVWIGWITSLFVCFFALPMHPRREQSQGVNDKPWPWIILSLSVACSGQLMLSGDPRLALLFQTLLLWAALVSPWLGLTLGFLLGRRVWSQAPSLSKQVLAICSSILPFGGLALPLWALSRGSFPHRVAWPPPDNEESQSVEIPQRTGNPTRESRDYCFSHLVTHLATAGKLTGLFRLAKETSFLADQIAHVKGFHKTQEDLESWIIPSAVQTGRWEEHIRFFSMAIHLRGVSEDLSDPTVLRVLTAQKELQIAEDAVQGVADPLNRAVAKAVVAGALDPSSKTRQNLVQTISYDLASLALPSDDSEQERQFWGLIIISQELGMAVVEALTAALEARREWSDAIWGSLAQCQANQTGRLDSSFWDLLSRVKDYDLLNSYLPDELTERDFSNLDDVLDHVDRVAGGDLRLGWLCRAALLGVIAARSSEEAWSLWQQWNASHPASWSIEFVERATPFLRSLDDRRIMDLAAAIQDGETRLAFWVSVLSADRDPQTAFDSALRTAEELPPSRLRTHWTLRLFSKPEIFGEEYTQAYLKDLLRSLHSTGYDADIPDLCQILTLIARHLPEDLPKEMEKALWAPAVGSEILFALVDESGGKELLAHLFENLDRYFAPFFPAEAEGFRAWSELLVKVTSRLCELRGDLLFLDRALRLNPEEADILRIATVKALTTAKRMELAETVCNSISSKRQRYLTRFELYQALPGSRAQASLHELFIALSDLEAVHEEILGLKALSSARGLSSPQAPAIIRSMKGPQEQFTVLLRLAWRGSNGRREPREVRHSLEVLSQAVGLVTSDAQLASWVPELIELVAYGRRHLVPEVREALQSLLSLRTVDWTMRRDLCESLLARALPWLSVRSEKRFFDETAKIAELIGDVLSDLLSDPTEKEKRSLIPVLFAVLDRLPIGVMERFLRDTTPSELFLLYLQGKDKLCEAWDREIEEQEPDPLVLESVLYLLSHCAPVIVPMGLSALPPGPFRDRISSNLLRHGWLPADFAPEVLPLIGDPEIRLRTEVWLGLSATSGSEEEEAWLGSLAALMSQSPLDPMDPRNEPCLRKLWTIDPKKSRPILAHAALQALIHQGRWHGMSAFCFWLHAHLAPDAGYKSEEVLLLCDQAQGAIQRSLRLAPGPASTNA